MNLNGIPESKNFQDSTDPKGLEYLKNVVGQYLYKHRIVPGANKKYYNPEVDDYHWKPGDTVKVDAQGRRADIDWGSNASLPGAAPLMSSPNDYLAKKMGFKDAATAVAYQKKQQEMRNGPAAGSSPASSDSLLDRVLVMHPKVLLGHVLDAFTKAGQ